MDVWGTLGNLREIGGQDVSSRQSGEQEQHRKCVFGPQKQVRDPGKEEIWGPVRGCSTQEAGPNLGSHWLPEQGLTGEERLSGGGNVSGTRASFQLVCSLLTRGFGHYYNCNRSPSSFMPSLLVLFHS